MPDFIQKSFAELTLDSCGNILGQIGLSDLT